MSSRRSTPCGANGSDQRAITVLTVVAGAAIGGFIAGWMLRSSTRPLRVEEQAQQRGAQPEHRPSRAGRIFDRAVAVVGALAGVAALGVVHVTGAPSGLPAVTASGPPIGQVGSVGSAAFSPDGATLAVGDSDGYTYLWNMATRTLVGRIKSPEPISFGAG